MQRTRLIQLSSHLSSVTQNEQKSFEKVQTLKEMHLEQSSHKVMSRNVNLEERERKETATERLH